jgi:cysteinyl-tRNA synthetase
MAKKYLGDTFDIHGGGIDNAFPHHECEIAQSVSANEKPFAHFFVHNNLVTINGQKMAKSLQNYIALDELLEKYNADIIRLYILKNHYRSLLDFSYNGLEETKENYAKIMALDFTNIQEIKEEYADIKALKDKCLEAINDDLNTALAFSIILEMVKTYHKEEDNLKKELLKYYVYDILTNIFGLRLEVKEKSLEAENLIELLINIRDDFKKEKNYANADLIRDNLKEIGIEIIDNKDKTTYRLK